MEEKERAEGAAPEKSGERLTREQADMLLLVDIVMEKSRAVKLITRPELSKAFRERAAATSLPLAGDLVREADDAIDRTLGRTHGGTTNVKPVRGRKDEAARAALPSTRDQRDVFTRRDVILNLLGGRAAEALEAAEASRLVGSPKEEAPEEPVPAREVTEEDFEATLKAALEGDFGLSSIVSWDGVEYIHYMPLLSSSYARILSAQNNPLELLCDQVRESSRIYPRPVIVHVFQAPPFNFKAEDIQEMLRTIAADPKTRDIRCTETSYGNLYLYSSKYLEDDYAEFLAEHLDGIGENP